MMNKCVLIGLPNTGKTSLFNQLTHSHLHTGNWSGVTVKAHEGVVQASTGSLMLIDLPGVVGLFDDYDQVDASVSLHALEAADVLIQVIDARHIHRDLIMTVQLLAYEKPMVVVLTHTEGDAEKLAALVPCKVLDARDIQKDEFVQHVLNAGVIKFDEVIEWPVGFSKVLYKAPQNIGLVSQLRWLLKADLMYMDTPIDLIIHEAFYNTVCTLLNRQGYVGVAAKQSIQFDRWLLSPAAGSLVFLSVMYVMFYLTINLGGALGEALSSMMMAFVSLLPSQSILGISVHAVMSGIAMCASFVPILWVMYGCIGYLEQTGYLARVALLADVMMRPLGLSGHSFIPLILGFGCNVPAIMAIRVVEGRMQRALTAMMIPFMSCSARLSILVIFASAFFPNRSAVLVLLLYLASLALAVGTCLWLKAVLRVQNASGLSMSLPAFQVPSLRAIHQQSTLRVKAFVHRTAKQIVIFSGLFGILAGIDANFGVAHAVEHSLLADLGRLITPLFAFMGIDHTMWQPVVALLAGVVAKEIVLTTLSSLYHIGAVGMLGFGEQIRDVVITLFEKLFLWSAVSTPSSESISMLKGMMPADVALAYMVFILLYFPCVSTLVVLNKECGWRWALLSFAWTSVLAVWAARVVYMGFGLETILLAAMMVVAVVLRRGYDAYTGQAVISATQTP